MCMLICLLAGCSGGKLSGKYYVTGLSGTAVDTLYMEFSGSNNVVISDNGNTGGTYTLEGNKLIITDQRGTYSYTVNDDLTQISGYQRVYTKK